MLDAWVENTVSGFEILSDDRFTLGQRTGILQELK